MSVQSTGIALSPAILVQAKLAEQNLSQVPDVHEVFHQSGWIHRHMASSRWINPFVGKVVFIMPVTAAMVAAETARYLGYDRLARSAMGSLTLFTEYMHSVPAVIPLIRTVNRPQELTEDFPYDIGVCLGSSLYFDYLYERSVGPSASAAEREGCLIECANLFVEGAPKEACLLHRTFSPPGPKGLIIENPHRLTLVPDDLRSAPDKGAIFFSNQTEIENLGDGSHLVLIDNASGYHALLVVKCSDSQGYLFDPAYGLFKLSGGTFGDLVVGYFNTQYRREHKYNYLQGKRAGLPASRLAKLWVDIFPMKFDAATPQFTQRNPALAVVPVRAPKSFLEDIAILATDTLRAGF